MLPLSLSLCGLSLSRIDIYSEHARESPGAWFLSGMDGWATSRALEIIVLREPSDSFCLSIASRGSFSQGLDRRNK